MESDCDVPDVKREGIPNFGERHGKSVNQMKGYDVERKVAEWKMNVWTLKLCETV